MWFFIASIIVIQLLEIVLIFILNHDRKIYKYRFNYYRKEYKKLLNKI